MRPAFWDRLRDRAQRGRSGANGQRLVGRHRLRHGREFRDGRHRRGHRRMVRGPAAVNNLVGLRPTLPLVSRFGMMPARPTTDTLGPDRAFGEGRGDCHGRHRRLRCERPGDGGGRRPGPGSYTQSLTVDGLKGARIGVIREPLDRAPTPRPTTTAGTDGERQLARGFDAAWRGGRRSGDGSRHHRAVGEGCTDGNIFEN